MLKLQGDWFPLSNTTWSPTNLWPVLGTPNLSQKKTEYLVKLPLKDYLLVVITLVSLSKLVPWWCVNRIQITFSYWKSSGSILKILNDDSDTLVSIPCLSGVHQTNIIALAWSDQRTTEVWRLGNQETKEKLIVDWHFGDKKIYELFSTCWNEIFADPPALRINSDFFTFGRGTSLPALAVFASLPSRSPTSRRTLVETIAALPIMFNSPPNIFFSKVRIKTVPTDKAQIK